jgi:hypothetical protein
MSRIPVITFAFKNVDKVRIRKMGEAYTSVFNAYADQFDALEWFHWKKDKVYEKLDKIKSKYHIDAIDDYDQDPSDARLRTDFALERVSEIIGITVRKLTKLVPELQYVENFGMKEILELLVVNYLKESIEVLKSAIAKAHQKMR